jgi:hypothetical protein
MLKHTNSNKIFSKLLLSIALFSVVMSVNAQLNTAVQVAVDSNKAAASTQKRIDTLNDQTDDLTGQYRNAINEIESLRAYNAQLTKVVQDQRDQVESMNQQMTHLEQTNRGVVPMIIEMVDMLGKIVEADIPFRKDERLKRVATLENLLDSSKVTTAELYRKVTEAYGIELDYGSTVDAYSGNLTGGKEVDFLRVGRTTLIYQTLTQDVSGWWNSKTNKFEELDRRYNAEIKEAIRIAKKQASPNLAGLPIFGATAAGE